MRTRAGLVGFALALACALAPLAARADSPSPVAQELTLDGVGIGTQAVYAAHGVIEAYFAPPVAPPALTGSFVRVFFAHSLDIGDGSTMLIAVDGQPLLTVDLTPGTANGGVVETAVPSPLLDQRQATRLQVRFDLRQGPDPQAALYGRINGLTMMHYQLDGAALPALDAYPYTLLPAGNASPPLGVVLPSPPTERDLGAAFRVLADLGRRAPSQHLQPQVVTDNQVAWLAQGGTPALLVGRVDALPAAAPVLMASGWQPSGTSWQAPDGRVLGPNDGLVLSATSPWDHRTSLVVVTGESATAVDKAAAVLAGSGVPLAGAYAVVSEAGSPSAAVPAASQVLLSMLSPRDLSAIGSGRYVAIATFTAPAANPDDTAVLDLSVPVQSAVHSGTVEADVNGSRVAVAPLLTSGTQPSEITVPFPGRVLRPGQNSLTLAFTIGGGTTSSAPPGQDGSLAVAGDEVANAAISLPSQPPAADNLAVLPYPFLQGSGPPRVVLADGTAETVTAAAVAMAALGSRLAQPPPSVRVAFATGWNGPLTAGVVVVGQPPAGSGLEAAGTDLPVIVGPSGSVRIDARTGTAQVLPAGGVGAVEEQLAPDESGPVLWLFGTDAAMLGRAAAAVYDTRLGGSAAVVDAGGRLTPVASVETVASQPRGPGAGLFAIAIASVLLAGVVGLQVVRPRRAS